MFARRSQRLRPPEQTPYQIPIHGPEPTECFVFLKNGLGNQLFQIAAAFAICKKYGRQLVISDSIYHNVHGEHWDTILRKCVRYRRAYSGQVPIWKEPGFRYTEIPSAYSAINGYFQSSRYFADCADEIRDLFEMPEATLTKYAELLTTPYTVIHIRRGDYQRSPPHGILTQNYYRSATGRMRELHPNAQFLVFSDDLPWARGLDFLADATFVDEPNAATALYLMSRFERYIISNSSFSWWAVWLGSPAKTVIAPDRWFGPTGPRDYQDVYEPSWIRIPAA